MVKAGGPRGKRGLTAQPDPAPVDQVAASAVPRPKRILWANVYCLLDTSSGASMAVREMLRQLIGRGYEIAVCGATIFDDERGKRRIESDWGVVEQKLGTVISVRDDPLVHYLLVTASHLRDAMTSSEENVWLQFYTGTLEKLQPDLVFYYGGQALDMMIADEARQRGIPVAAYLANPNYSGTRWCRDVDLILTDSEATARLYADRCGYAMTPVGTFIDPVPVLAVGNSRDRILFVNPSMEKGAAVVVMLALMMEKRRPDIVFEVVESRGNWHGIVERVTTALGAPRKTLPNVRVTPNSDDMRPVYGRARILLAPSLWWESAGRVIAEAMINGIPALVAAHGGPPEMMDNAGYRIEFPPECLVSPYEQMPSETFLAPVIDVLVRFYEDPDFYVGYVERAFRVASQRHSLANNTTRLEQALAPLLARNAGARTALAVPESTPAGSVPEVSVILPVGNREAYLREAIDSVLAQTHQDFELLLVADGVPSPVAAILSSYVDPRIRLLRMPVNVGISGARNVGLAAARGQFIALMDSDDVALPHRLATQVGFLRANPDVTVCASNAIKCFDDGSRVAMRYPQTDGIIKAHLLIVDSSILNPTAMYRADFVREHRLRYDPSFPPDDDHRFYVDMTRAGARFAAVPDELLLYRRHATNYTNDMTGVDAIKTRVREMLVPWYFPKLRGDEVSSLLLALSTGFPAVPGQVSLPGQVQAEKAITVIDKALKETRSFFGEDRAEVANVLGECRRRIEAWLAAVEGVQAKA